MKCSKCNSEMVCVDDFCGNMKIEGETLYQVNMWADYCAHCKTTEFGGLYGCIPDLYIENEPSEDELLAYTNKYRGEMLKRYLEAINDKTLWGD